MLTRKASKALLFLLIFIASSSFVLQPVNAQESGSTQGTIADQAFIINPDWLSVSAIEFNGQPFDYTGKQDRLNVDIGGYGMTNFVNHGEIAVDSVTNTHVFMAEMDFPVSAVVYIDCMIDDVYPDHLTDTKEVEWLSLKTFLHWQGSSYWGDIDDNNHYNIRYDRIGTGVVDTQEYDGNLRLKATIHPDLPIEEGGFITINGVQFKVPDIRIFIENAELLERTYGVCDDPKNFYTDSDSVIAIRKEDLQDTVIQKNGKTEAESKCGVGYDSNKGTPYDGEETAKDIIKWAGPVEPRILYYGVTYTSGDIGQAYASSPTVGSVWSREDDLNDYDEEFEFDSHIRIKPNIFYDMEQLEVRHAYIYVDRYKEPTFPDYGLCDVKDEYTESHTRIVGLGVQNIFIKMKYNIKVTMLLSIQPTSEEGESILEDPEIYQGDIIWDNTIGGTTDARATIAEPQTWATDLADSWNKFWTDTGEWFNDQIDWWKEGIDDAWDNWFDWWKNWSPETLMNWWQKFWWIIILIAIVVVGIIGFYIFYPRIARGTARGITEYQQGQIENQQKPT